MIYRESFAVECGIDTYEITVFATERAVTGIFRGRCGSETPNEITSKTARQIREYFGGNRKQFSIPLDLTLGPDVTPFRLRVWQELMKVPFGETVTYGELARRIGKPSAARAVGGAVGMNPLLIAVPCHRVVAKDGIGGFSAGVDLKSCLMRLEGILNDSEAVAK